MITCRDARQLFDRYLDGELSASLQTELNAHRLNCTECQNELAMAEAIGDVVSLDRHEPIPSASFTDRVLLARRAQLSPRPRQWNRLIAFIGAPLAAAASLAFALFVVSPTGSQTRVLGGREAAPIDTQIKLIEAKGTQLTPKALEELAETPQMPAPAAGFEGFLAPIVDQSKNTYDNVRRSAEELAYLLHLGLNDTNQMLVAQWESAQHVKSANDADRSGSDTDAVDPDPCPPQDDTAFGTRTGVTY